MAENRGRVAATATAPVAVEDIPAHDIYAEIVGIRKRPTLGRTTETICQAPHPGRGSRPSAAVAATTAFIVVEDENDDGEDEKDKNNSTSTSQSATALPLSSSSTLPSTTAATSRAATHGSRSRRTMSLLENLRQSEKIQKDSTNLVLDPSNRGFKMLQRMGWQEKDGGLGRQRQGSMQPVKTILKADKKGLGAGRKKRARVTHPASKTSGMNRYEKNDRNAGESKAQRKQRRAEHRARQVRMAKKTRMLLRTNVSEEYEALYMKLH